MRPQNKLLGQHWLYDEAALDAVLDAADIRAGDTVLEVGPGLGTLTERILLRDAKVIAVEKDQLLADRLEKNTQITVVNDDILKYDLNHISTDYKVAANIPYYLTSALIRKLLESKNQPKSIGILIQKEVAERLVAEPGQMSVLSFSAQYYAKVSLGQIVPAEMFDPPPKVDSQVVSLKPYEKPAFEADVKILFSLVKAGFAEKRKKLLNSLAGSLGLDKEYVKHLLIDAKINQNARAQELSINSWESLYKTYIATL